MSNIKFKKSHKEIPVKTMSEKNLIVNEEKVEGISRRQVVLGVGGLAGLATLIASTAPALTNAEAYAEGYKAAVPLMSTQAASDWNTEDSSVKQDVLDRITAINTRIDNLVSSNTTIQNNIDGLDSILDDVVVVSGTAPTNTKRLWIDTNMMGVIKYHNGTSWVACTSVWG